jgi:hypothetical protein
MPSSLLQVVNSLFQQTGNKQCEHNLLTACELISDTRKPLNPRVLVNRLVTTCLQTCYKLCVFIRVQYVFYSKGVDIIKFMNDMIFTVYCIKIVFQL